MPEGPTTEGSIVAYLRLDDSDWNTKLDEAEARAKELGRTNPNIRVTADTADAAAKLEEIKALEDRAGGTVTTTTVSRSVSESSGSSVASDAASKVDSVAAATKRLALAKSQLAAATEQQQAAEVRHTAAANAASAAEDNRWRIVQKYTVSDDAKAKATERAATATMRADLAAIALESSERKVAEASAKVAAAESAAAAATDKAAAASDKAGKANQGNASKMGLIVAGVAALLPLAAPLGGFALGGAAALTAMGAAGVLALKGIGAEMAADTDLGNQYQDSLATVQDDLHKLEATAAAGVITPFNKALEYLQPQMPRINQDMGAMASWAGQIAGTSLQAIIGGFEAMEPLLVSGERLLQGWASNMVLFARSPEFREFIQYAVTELPQVNGLLINLAGVAVHIIDALTPLGTAIVPVLSAVAFALNAIPTPVLTGLAVGATAVGAAFLAWNYAIEPLLSKMGVLGAESAGVAAAQAAVAVSADAAAAAEDTAAAATTGWGAAIDFATGPAGIIFGLIAAISGGMLASAASTAAATKAQADFSAAIQSDNGAIREHVTLSAAKQLSDQGAYQAANQLGIAQDTVTKAVLGQDGAYKALTTQLDGIISKSKLTAGAHQGNAGALTSEGRAAQSLLGVVKSLNGTLSDNLKTNQSFAGAAVAAGAASQALAEDQNILDDASKSADSATQGYITALEAYAKSAGTAADQGAFLGATLVAMQGDWLSYDTALANANFANYTLTQTFQDQGKEVSQGVKYLRDTEKAAIDLNTGMIDVSKSGAPALLQQLSAMQSAAQKAAEATYQHEQATKGAGQAAADAATIFKGDTYDALVKDADQLGLTADQAKKLADRYFGLPSDVVTQLQTQGQSTVVQTLDGIGQQLAEITGHPWTSTLDANGVPLSHQAYLAQLRIDDVKNFADNNPAVLAADAAHANMTVDQFKQHLVNIPDKTVHITADTAAAEAAIARLQANSTVVANAYANGNVYTTGKADGGVIYRAEGGPAYLAMGGSPFQPRGTDTVPAMLTAGEFVVKEKSASYDRGFISAYNADPARALASVQRGGAGVTVVISPKGGIDLTKYIDVQVQQGTSQAMGNFAMQIQGGSTL